MYINTSVIQQREYVRIEYYMKSVNMKYIEYISMSFTCIHGGGNSYSPVHCVHMTRYKGCSLITLTYSGPTIQHRRSSQRCGDVILRFTHSACGAIQLSNTAGGLLGQLDLRCQIVGPLYVNVIIERFLRQSKYVQGASVCEST